MLQIRPARKKDLNRLVELGKRYKDRIGKWWTCKKTWETHLKYTWVLQYKDQIVGVKVERPNRSGYRRIMCLVSELKGGGWFLLKHSPAKTVALVSVRNRRAISAYYRAGFDKAMRVKIWVGGKPKWMWVMVK